MDQESAVRLVSFCCSNSTEFPSLFVPLSALNTRPMERQVGKPILLVLVCVNSLGAKTELSCFGPEVDWLWDCAGLVGLPQTWQCGSYDQLLWTCLYRRLPQWLEPFHRRFSQQGCKGQFTRFKTGDILRYQHSKETMACIQGTFLFSIFHILYNLPPTHASTYSKNEKPLNKKLCQSFGTFFFLFWSMTWVLWRSLTWTWQFLVPSQAVPLQESVAHWLRISLEFVRGFSALGADQQKVQKYKNNLINALLPFLPISGRIIG